MTGERMIPMLPCADIDGIADFAAALGFTVTYRQTRPNPYLALRREDIELHYFAIEGFRPEDCGVVAPDPKLLIDPGGNWIRVIAARAEPEPAGPEGRLARSLADAVVIDDSHGDVEQAAKILGGAVRDVLTELAGIALPAVDRVEVAGALAQAAELAAALPPQPARTP